MDVAYPSRFAHVPQKAMISKSWFFRLWSLAFIVQYTPALAFYLHGYAGFLSILGLAVLAGLVESSFNETLYLIAKGISQNRLLFMFVIWYLVGFELNAFSRGRGLDDWRLMLGPLIVLIGLLYAFGFMHDGRCYRYFQIGLIIVSGIQTFFSVQVLSHSINIARVMWAQTSGAWIYGNQAIYATYAIVTPVLLWRAFKESGPLRLILILSCLFIVITSSISSFATPLGLTILSALIVLALSIFLLTKKVWTVILVAGIISAIALFGYQYTHDNPLFFQAYFRIENFIRNPKSGGYDLRDPIAVSRWELAQISIRTFQAEPLLGMGGPRDYNPFIGRHSSFFDTLAIYGLLGGGGALCGIVLILLANATRQYWHKHSWESLLILTIIILLAVVGIADPYWEGIIPLVMIIARPFSQREFHTEKVNSPVRARPVPLRH